MDKSDRAMTAWLTLILMIGVFVLIAVKTKNQLQNLPPVLSNEEISSIARQCDRLKMESHWDLNIRHQAIRGWCADPEKKP